VNEQFRMKFGRMVAGVRTWETDLDMPMLAEELQHEYHWQPIRNAHHRRGWSSVGNIAIRRRDNTELPYIVYLSEADMRRFQEFGLWSADFEPITSYFDVYYRAGAAYTDKTTPAMNLNGTYTIVNATDRIYIGADEPFNNVDFYHSTFGTSVARTVNYYNGSWGVVSSLVDNTTLFTTNGNLTFTLPTDWTKTTQNGDLPNKYWIEINFSAATIKPIWRYTRPTIPIMVLLEQSTDGGVTWDWYHDESYYPNLWVIEKVVLRFQVGGRHTVTDVKIVEGM